MEVYALEAMTLRAEIERLVAAIEPFDAQEAEQIAFVQNWIASGCEIFRTAEPATPKMHLVVHFLPVDAVTHQVLLVDHKKGGLWLPPGGHVEVGEHPKAAVAREIQEELGVKADFLFEEPFFLSVGHLEDDPLGHTDVSLLYLLRGFSSDEYFFDRGEFFQIQWFSPEEIPSDRFPPQMRRCLKKMTREVR